MSSRPHGYARYRLDRCRCYVCGFARSEYDERRTKMLTAGTWQPFVPSQEAREWLVLLRDTGFGERQIAKLADLNRKTVHNVMTGDAEKIRTATAAAILAVPADQLAAAPGVAIDSTLTWSLIDALLEAGMTRGQIAQEALGVKVPALQLRRGQRVSVANATKIKAYFDRILGDSWLDDPTYIAEEDLTVTPRSGPASASDDPRPYSHSPGGKSPIPPQ